MLLGAHSFGLANRGNYLTFNESNNVFAASRRNKRIHIF